MIRVLALAHMVDVYCTSSELLYSACGEDETYIDLINVLPNVAPIDGDERTLIAARLKAGIKPEHIREVDNVDYTSLQMYRMKKSERPLDAAIRGAYTRHNPGWYPQMARAFYINVLSNIQLDDVYTGYINTLCKLCVLQTIMNAPTFIRLVQRLPEYIECWNVMRSLGKITPGMLEDYPVDRRFYRMIGVAKGNSPENYTKLPLPEGVNKFVEDYNNIIETLYEDIMSLQGHGIFNEELMLNGGDNFEFV